MVDHDHDAIKTITFRKICNEIASDLGERSGTLFRFDQNEAGGGRVSIDFHLLTNGASHDIVLNEDCHSWPPIMALHKF